MTKEEAIEALRATLQPGESVTVERPKRLDSLTDSELSDVYLSQGSTSSGVRAVVMADRQREVERLRERWRDFDVRCGWRDIAELLGVEVQS